MLHVRVQDQQVRLLADLNCYPLHLKSEGQFRDVLFSTISLTCMLSLSPSIIQARINTQHAPASKMREGEANLSLNLDYGSIYVWPLKRKICGKHVEPRLSGGKL